MVVTSTHLEESFYDLVGDNFLKQFIAGPTHVTADKLDLLFCNSAEIIKNVMTWSPEQFTYLLITKPVHPRL